MNAEDALELTFLPDGNLSEVEDSESDSDELDFATVNNNNNKGTCLESEVLENDDMAVEADAATEEARPSTSTAKKNPKKYEWKKVPLQYIKTTLLIWCFLIHQMRYCPLLLILKCLLMMSA